MEAFSFGSYYPGDSAIHRLDPRTKLLLGFVFLITTLTVSSFRNYRCADLYRVPGAASPRPVIDGAAAGDRRGGRGAQPIYRPERADPVAARLSAD